MPTNSPARPDSPSRPDLEANLPQDVIDLVIAAREAFDTGFLSAGEQGALDAALERFSALVPYADDGHE
jgi:hypothetical protein